MTNSRNEYLKNIQDSLEKDLEDAIGNIDPKSQTEQDEIIKRKIANLQDFHQFVKEEDSSRPFWPGTVICGVISLSLGADIVTDCITNHHYLSHTTQLIFWGSITVLGVLFWRPTLIRDILGLKRTMRSD